jgi:hypothetical protein
MPLGLQDDLGILDKPKKVQLEDDMGILEKKPKLNLQDDMGILSSSQYETKLIPEEEIKFKEWKAKYAPNDSGIDYDLRGAFKEGLTPNPETGHWPDTYKKPNHPTFSNESIYATGENAKKAGHWEGNKFIKPTQETSQNKLNLIDDAKIFESPKSSILQESLIKPIKSFYSGVLNASAHLADTIDFYADKVSKALGKPESKDGIFDYLRDNWATAGQKLAKEGLSEGFTKELYQGLGQASFDVPVLMAGGTVLKAATLPVAGAVEGFKEGGIGGATKGAISGVAMHGVLKGLSVLSANLKYPTAFAVGAITTPGDVKEKVTGGAIFAGLSIGPSPTKEQFKATMKESPLGKGIVKILPFKKRESIYQDFVNRMQSIENIVERAKNLGADIKPGEDPGMRSREYLGIGGKVRSVLEDKTFRITSEGKIETTGEGLRPILDDYAKTSSEKNINIRDKDLNDYLIAQRTIKDLQRPKSEFTEKNIVTPEQVKKAQDTLNNLNSKYKEGIQHLDQTATRLYDYQKRVLSTLVDSGNLSQEQFNTILAKNPNYVPFDRVIEGIEPTSGTPISKNRFTGARSPIKRIKGSELEIHNPIESMIKNTYRIMDIAERNTVVRSVAKLAEVLPEDISPVKVKMQPIKTGKYYTEGGAETIFRPSQFKPKGNVVEYFEEGKRKYMEVSPNLYQAMTGLNEASSSLMIKVLSQPAQWLRTGATITPEFMVRNFIRDQFTAVIQTRFGFKPFFDSSAAIADIMGKSEVYYDWLRSGGAYSGFVELSRPKLQKALLELKNNPSLLKKLNIISTAGDISQLLEQATRVGTYNAAIKSGMTPIEAGFQSREATVDFGRKGAKTKDVNAVIAFFNAGIQGADKSFRMAKEDPMGLTAKGVALITIPSLLLYLKNREDPDYKEIPRWQRDLFWVTKVGDAYVRIPKPFVYGQVFGSIPERFFEYLDSNDKQSFDGLAKSVYDSLSPVAGDPTSGLIPTAFKPLIENQANWNFFRQRQIVPPGKERLLPEYQTDKYTTESAKLLGKVLKQSPAKLENLVQGYFGGTGRYALEGTNALINGIKRMVGQKIESRRPTEPSDIIGIKGFVAKSPESQPESIQKFYDNKNSYNQVYNSYLSLVKQGKWNEVKQLKEKYPKYYYSKTIDKYADIISSYGKQIDYAINSKTLMEGQKKEKIRELERKRMELAQKANEFLKNRGQ